jgi:hypothetical protein
MDQRRASHVRTGKARQRSALNVAPSAVDVALAEQLQSLRPSSVEAPQPWADRREQGEHDRAGRRGEALAGEVRVVHAGHRQRDGVGRATQPRRSGRRSQQERVMRVPGDVERDALDGQRGAERDDESEQERRVGRAVVRESVADLPVHGEPGDE